ncbi:hypothetical protein AB2M62_08670 [Sphingomonas sp. MMS12-HWE2-04]|uniref:hypothetical protein n=1 Tax=Sphingomonas sp. MMS12-HWE2-04 TaxID=3234199 RepID=UPI00384E0E26
MFKYVSFLFYGVYALHLILSLAKFRDRIANGLATPRLGPAGHRAGCLIPATHHRRSRYSAGAPSACRLGAKVEALRKATGAPGITVAIGEYRKTALARG